MKMLNTALLALMPFILLFVTGIIAGRVTLAQDRRAKREAVARAAKAAAEAAARSNPEPGPDGNGGSRYWATGYYDPDRFHAFVQQHRWSHVHYVKDAYGDLDTYEANKPD